MRRPTATRFFGDVAKIFVGVAGFSMMSRESLLAREVCLSLEQSSLCEFSSFVRLFRSPELGCLRRIVVLARSVYLKRVGYLAKPVGLASFIG